MYEEKFRRGLKKYLETNHIKHVAIAEKAGIKSDVFSKLLNTNRRIFAEEVGSICVATGMTFEELANYDKQTG